MTSVGLFYTLYKDINIYTTHKKKNDNELQAHRQQWTRVYQTILQCVHKKKKRKKKDRFSGGVVIAGMSYAGSCTLGYNGFYRKGSRGRNQPHSGLDRAILAWHVRAHEDLWEMMMMMMMVMRVIIQVSNTNIVFSAPDGSFCDYNPAQIAVFPSSGLSLIERSCNYCHLRSEFALNQVSNHSSPEHHQWCVGDAIRT